MMILFTLAFVGFIASSNCVDVGDEVTGSEWQSAFCSLQLKDGSHRCGCTIISDRLLLTSAYCAGIYLPEEVQVALGSIDLKNPKVIKNVEKMIINEDYHLDHWSNLNDIGLIKLDSKIEFDEDIQPALLPSEDEALYWKECKMIGWGKLADPENCKDNQLCVDRKIVRQQCDLDKWYQKNCKESCFDYTPKCCDVNHDILREADVTILPNVVASLTYDEETITKNVACVLDRANKKATATKLDAGGPLFCKKGDGWNLVGVSSYREKAPYANVIQIYTIISKYVEWIASKTSSL